MWNLSSNSSYAPWGLFNTQKRGYHGINQFNTVNIMPDKSFSNPNFVNQNYPTLLGCEKKAACDANVTYTNTSKNSSLIIDTIKRTHPEIIQKSEPREMCTKRTPGKNCRKTRRAKYSGKKNKDCISRAIADSMDIEPECSNENIVEISISPKPLHLTDFLTDNIKNADSMDLSDNHDIRETIGLSITPNLNKNCKESITFSITPPNHCKILRERQMSLCESEDSFVVFESGSEDECNFSETSEDEHSDSESEFDSSGSVIPNKRVRFAEDGDLCEVHPMVQWAYAYQAARKGPWETYARDRERFRKRISDTEKILSPIFDCYHRENVFKERFKISDL